MKYLLLLSLTFTIPTFAHTGIETPVKSIQENQKIMKGTIEREQFENKIGKKVKGIYDYKFTTKNKTYHINLHESSVTEAEMKQILGKKIKVALSVKDGLWDTDDPNVQSRVGEYVAIHEVL